MVMRGDVLEKRKIFKTGAESIDILSGCGISYGIIDKRRSEMDAFYSLVLGEER